jgi:hypothetical protein
MPLVENWWKMMGRTIHGLHILGAFFSGAHFGNTVVIVFWSRAVTFYWRNCFCGIQGMGASWFRFRLTNIKQKVETES